MSVLALDAAFAGVWPAVATVALCAARLLPVSLLCPVLGGQVVPVTVRLGLVLSLSTAVHVVGGVRFQAELALAPFLGALARELMLGTVIGLVATLPFEAARMAGRISDLARGTNAEAALPGIGTRESATGELMHQLLVALVVTGVAFPRILSSLWRSFGAVGLGAQAVGEGWALEVTGLVGAALSTGLAVGAPVVALVMAVDLGLGFVSRAAAPLSLQDLSAPLKILGGGVVLWLAVGLASERLLTDVFASAGTLERLLGSAG